MALAYDRVATDPDNAGDLVRHALIGASVCLLRRHERTRDTGDLNRALERLATAARRPPHHGAGWTDVLHRFIGVVSVHAQELTHATSLERWLGIADELFGLASGELASPGWYRHVLLLAYVNAAAGERRWAAALRLADAARAGAAAAGDNPEEARADKLSDEMRQRLAEAAGTAEEVSVDLDDLMRSIGDRSDPAAARKRLSTLRAAVRQISPADDLRLWAYLSAGLIQELITGPTGDPVDNIEAALDLVFPSFEMT